MAQPLIPEEAALLAICGEKSGLAWNESVELIDLPPEGASDLKDIISRMLAWVPTHRYPDAAAVLVDLGRLEGQPWARQQKSGVVPFKDSSLGLAGFGLLELWIALCCLGPIAFVILIYLLAVYGPTRPMSREATVMEGLRLHAAPLLFCLAAAVFFTCIGIGSMLARRWAGTLMLIASWIWLYCGVVSTALVAFISFETTPLFDFWFILMPSLFVLFYSRPNVKATLAARDLKMRWTDRCPAPVLAIALLLVLGAACSLAFATVGRASAFGTFYLVLAAVFLSIAVAVYHLRPWAWWVLLGLCMVGLIVGFLTPAAAPQVSTPELWSRPPQPPPPPPGVIVAEVISIPSFSYTKFFWVLWSQSFIGYFVYLLWIKKYFSPRFRVLATYTPAVCHPPAIRR